MALWKKTALAYREALISDNTCFHYAARPKPWEAWGSEQDKYWWYYARKTEIYESVLMTKAKESDIVREVFDDRPKKIYCLFGLRIAKVTHSKKNKKYYLFGIKYFTIKIRKS